MAKLYTVKQYVAGGTYHIYNRGSNKQPIFFKPVDYWVFRRFGRRAIERTDNQIKTVAFSLIPNHYHLEMTQLTADAMTKFMRSLMCSYTAYINKKYSREGGLYGNIYCARYLATAAEIEQVKKYILANPIEAGLTSWKHVGINL